jgi:SpoVK/Ycf46/Vps4 family AAA+-type ATPase
MIYNGLGKNQKMPRWMTGNSPEPLWLRRFLGQCDLADTWFQEGFLQDDPVWLERLLHLEEAKVARSFLLTGNITDYAFDPVSGYRPTSRLLIEALMNVKDCILTFSLSKGLSVYSKDPGIKKRLPQTLLNRIGQGLGWHNMSLVSVVCGLFNDINQWLSGTGCDANEPDSFHFTKGVAIVFENVHLIIPSEASDLERNFLVDNLLRWSNSPELFRSSHCLILLAETLEGVSNELRLAGGKIEQITIPRPDKVKTRLKFLIPLLDPGSKMKETRVAQLKSGIARLEGYDGTYLERLRLLSHDTAGLTLVGIEDLLQEASVGHDAKLCRNTVMNLKREHLRQESDGLLEVLNPRETLDDIGGYQELKTRLREVIHSLKRSHDPLFKATIPMGLLFLGPPGTGKSIMATAMAGESGVSMAKLGDFRGMYVGQSERNLSRIFSLIESLHPVIVFIDEIDQALGQRSTAPGEGGVDSRIFGKFLEFMSNTEHRGKVLWVGASNFPQKIDPAIKRPGRFDLTIPFLLPDLESRGAIIKVVLKGALKQIKDIHYSLNDQEIEDLAKRTEGFSGAELQAIVNEVLRRIAGENVQQKAAIAINKALFDSVIDVYKPPPEQRAGYYEMELLAIEQVSFLNLLPEKYRNQRLQSKPSGHNVK